MKPNRDSEFIADIDVFARTDIVKQNVGLAKPGQVQIRKAVIVDVAPGRTLDPAEIRDPRLRRNIRKRAVTIIVVKLTWICLGTRGLVTNK